MYKVLAIYLGKIIRANRSLQRNYRYRRSSVVEEVSLKFIGPWSRTCNYLALLAGREQSRAEHRERQPPGGLLFTLFCVRHEVVPQQIDKALFEESGEGNISQPVSEVAAEAGTFFSTEFSWHAASHTFSPRTARKIKVVLISSNMKKEEALPWHSTALLSYRKKGKKKNFFWSHTKAMSVSHFEFKTHAQRKGTYTCCSSSVQPYVGSHT